MQLAFCYGKHREISFSPAILSSRAAILRIGASGFITSGTFAQSDRPDEGTRNRGLMRTPDKGHVDTHCHLGWFADPAAVARDAAALDLEMLAVTVNPEEYLRTRESLEVRSNVALAAGLHPWWVREARDADALCELLPETRFVGEIGLDAAPRHAANWDAQLRAFERICDCCAKTSAPTEPKVLSIHAVRCTGTVLDVLEHTGAAEACYCILHWFSGSPDELWRAVHLGCRFSLGERSLATRRGREYARILPAELLLTETDLPEGKHSPSTAEDIVNSLERTVAGIAAARNTTAEAVQHQVTVNAMALLG